MDAIRCRAATERERGMQGSLACFVPLRGTKDYAQDDTLVMAGLMSESLSKLTTTRRRVRLDPLRFAP
jgi:hypothetical protein